MKEYLTSKEHLAFRRIDKMMQLRQGVDNSALILLGINTAKLALAFDDYFISLKEVERFTPQTINPLYELSDYPNDKFYLLNLYEHQDIHKLIKALQFGRDFIAQYNLKVILLFDAEHYEQLQEEAYDFFSVNSYSYAFVDHSYDFLASTIKKSEKLTEYMQEYEAYLNEKNILPKIEVELLFNIAKEAYAFSQIDLAFEYYEKALQITKDEKLLFEKGAILGNIGNIYRAKGDNEEALKYLKEALEIHREIGYTQGVANQLGNIGLIYRAKGDNEEALKYHKEALEIDREIGYTQGVATQLGNIGLIYSDRGDMEEALKYYKEALEIDREIGYTQGVANQLGNIGNIYRAKGDLDEALKYLKEALKIDIKIGYTQGVASDLGNIGLIYRAKGDLDKALKYYKEALEIFKEIGYKYGMDIVQSNIDAILNKK